jgi:hypothetical protein
MPRVPRVDMRRGLLHLLAAGVVLATASDSVDGRALLAPPDPSVVIAEPSWQRLDDDVALGGHSAILDTVADRILVLGDRTDEVRSLDLATPGPWVRTPVPGVRPPDRLGLPVAQDAARMRWILVRPGSSLGTANDTEVWILELLPTPNWTLVSRGSGPGIRNFHTLAIDTKSNRLFLYGGTFVAPGTWDVPPADAFNYYPRDLWMCDLDAGGQWQAIDLGGNRPAIGPRSTTVVDEARRRILVAGVNADLAGYGETRVWSMELDAGSGGSFEWTTLVSYLPLERMPLAMAASLDVTRDRLYLSGALAVGNSTSDVISWESSVVDLQTGTSGRLILTAPVFPPGRYGMAGVHDQRRDRHLFIGGWRASNERSPSREIWALRPQPSDLRHAFWERVGPWAGGPPVREGEAAVFDPRTQKVLVSGGADGWPCFWTNCVYTMYSDLWAFDLRAPGSGEWSALPVVPQRFELYGRALGALGLDVARNRVLLFGGATGSPRFVLGNLETIHLAGSGEWDRLAPEGASPPARMGHGAVLDPRRQRWLVLDGAAGLATSSPAWSDAWAFDLATDHWSALPLAPGSTTPGKALEAVLDVERDRILAVTPAPSADATCAVWELDLASPTAWRSLPMTPGSHPRTGRVCYDPPRRRVLLFEDIPPQGDQVQRVAVWALDETNSSRWIEIATGPSPSLPGLALGPVVYDGIHDRFVIANAGRISEVWALTFGAPRWPVELTWQTRSSEPRLPGREARITVHARSSPTSWIHPQAVDLSAFDPSAFEWTGAVMLLDSEGRPRATFGDVDFDGAADWTIALQLVPDPAHPGAPIRFGTTNAAGAAIEGSIGSLIASVREEEVDDTEPSAPDLSLGVRAVGPMHEAVRLALRSSTSGAIDVSLHDVRGRRVARRTFEHGGAGEEEHVWRDLRGLPPGIYLARARRGTETASTRLIRL